MDAYCSVDGPIRKKLVETLKTWKEPRAYFPLEITKRIESALIQARTAALNQQNRQSQSQQDLYRRGLTVQQQPPYQNTSTPPQRGGPYQPPPSVGPSHFINGNVSQQVHCSHHGFECDLRLMNASIHNSLLYIRHLHLSKHMQLPLLLPIHRSIHRLILGLCFVILTICLQQLKQNLPTIRTTQSSKTS